jgi:Ca2+-binding EF-hand superfamily protein
MGPKFDYAFACLDQNGSGRLDQADFFQLGERLRATREWSRSDPRCLRIHAALDDFWQVMLLCVDEDGSGDVDRHEFLLFEQLMAEQTAEFAGQAPPWVLDLFVAIFESLDLDGDKRISATEYALYLRAMGSSMDAAAAFERLDLDGSGFIELAELAALLAEYFTSADPDARGNYLVTGGWPAQRSASAQ